MNYNKYTQFKNSGVEWLGEIPEHWEVRKIKYIANCFPSNVDKHTREDEKKVRLCNYTDVYYNDFIYNDMILMNSTASNGQINKFSLLKNDVVITKDSETADDIAVPAYIIEDLNNVICGYHLSVIRPLSTVYGKYIFRLFQFKNFNSQFEINSNGVTRVGLGVYDLKNAIGILPPLPEQTAIANFLDYKLEKIDRFITKKKQLIELLNEQKAAIINQAVTKGLNHDFKGLNDEHDFKKSGNQESSNQESSNQENPKNQGARQMKASGIEWLGDIPESWEVRKLKFVGNCFPSNIDKHSKEDEEQVRLCNYTDVYKNDFITNEMDLMIATAKEEQIEKFTLLENDVIITKDSETADDIANPALVTEALENVVCGYHLSVLRPYKKLDGGYLFRALQCKPVNVQFELCSMGVTRVGLGVYDMKSAKIPIPPKKEQKEIFEHIQIELNKIAKTITTIEKEISLVEEYKTALIAEAVTGKINVLNHDFKD